MRSLHPVVLLGSLFLVARATEAQEIRPPDGFWMGLGLGNGGTVVHCASCVSGRTGGMAGYAELGGTPAPTVRFGGRLSAWRKRAPDRSASLTIVSAMLAWSPRQRFLVRGGIGGMAYAERANGQVIRLQAPVMNLGVGYELRIRSAFALAPYIDHFFTLGSGNGGVNGAALPNTADAVRSNSVQFGLGVHWY